jgi:hypothetical protein
MSKNSVKIKLATVLTLITMVVGATLWVTYEHGTFAKAEEVIVVKSKADAALDELSESMLKRIAFYERKKNKTADEIDFVNHLRDRYRDLKNMRAK